MGIGLKSIGNINHFQFGIINHFLNLRFQAREIDLYGNTSLRATVVCPESNI